MNIGPRTSARILKALGVSPPVLRSRGLTCPLLDPSTGEPCRGLQASVDGAGRFRCPRCGAVLDPVALTMRVRNLSREGAVEWIEEQVAADAELPAPPSEPERRMSARWSGEP